MSAHYRNGMLSTDQVIAAASFATPDTEAGIVERVEERPARYALDVARHHRAARACAEEKSRWRSLYWGYRDDEFRLRAVLPAAEGAVVARALERIAVGTGPDPQTGLFASGPAQWADALVELASARLGADADPDRATVVVHVDAADLAAGRGAAELEHAPSIPMELARRLACDCRLEVVAEGAAGPVGIGRASRTVPGWLLRHLRHRDGGCAFPGCGRRRYLHAHHIRHWADGGPTDAGNLLLVCLRHHKLLHERGWSIAGSPGGPDLAFFRPDGRPFDPGLAPPGPDLTKRLVSWGLVEVGSG